MKKFLWWGISLYFSISLQVTAFAQSNLSNISFNQPLKYRMDYIDPRFKLTKEQFRDLCTKQPLCSRHTTKPKKNKEWQ